MRALRVLPFFCLLFLTIACTKKEVIYSKEQMLKMAPNEGPDKVEIILARNLNDVIPCSTYGDGCLSVHRLRAQNLDFLAIEFTHGELAKKAALKIHGWTVENWLFDDIDGEPVLQRWLQKYYKGVRFKPLETTTGSAKKSARID